MQEELNKPKATNQEIILDPTREIMSKTDGEGIIEFVNDYFVEVSGYEEYELLGKTMHCTQHPDMPNIIFKMMWERLLDKQNFNVLVKNLAKDGRYYWAISDFAFKEDAQGNVIAIYNRRKIATPHAIRYFENLYQKLKNIEEESGYIYAEKYLIGHEEEKGKNIEEILYDFQSNLQPPTPKDQIQKKEKKVVLEDVSIPEQENTILDLTQQEEKPSSEVPLEELSIKERLARLKEIHEKTIQALDIDPKPTKVKDPIVEEIQKVDKLGKEETKKEVEPAKSKKKKGLFQKLFGKTEEELEEERRRRGE